MPTWPTATNAEWFSFAQLVTILAHHQRGQLVGHPGIPAAPMANPEAMVVLTAGGGWIDDSMTGFADALGAAFDGAPHIARHFEKLKNADARRASPVHTAARDRCAVKYLLGAAVR
jgi:hypothetical protein